VHKRIISAVKRVQFVSDRMSYIMLRGRWCQVIVLNVHAPTEDKTDDMKDSFYEELERVFDQFPKYLMKILLGDFSSKVHKEDIFKPTIGNESLHEISNDNGVRAVNLPHLKHNVPNVSEEPAASIFGAEGHFSELYAVFSLLIPVGVLREAQATVCLLWVSAAIGEASCRSFGRPPPPGPRANPF
jgi:hypothetical protein